jgi:hypothetical protein
MNRTPASRSDSSEPESGPAARLSILGTTDLRASDGTLIALFWPELAADQARRRSYLDLHPARLGGLTIVVEP